jgi:hypothetical protein
MKSRLLVIGLISMLAISCSRVDARGGAASEAASIVGTWRALEYVFPGARDSASKYPYGRPPKAYLVYDNTGRVFFQAVRGQNVGDRRTRWHEADSSSLVRILSDADAYFGTYRVDHQRRTVTHRIEAEIPPSSSTIEIATHFRLNGDTLVIGRDSSLHWIFVRAR